MLGSAFRRIAIRIPGSAVPAAAANPKPPVDRRKSRHPGKETPAGASRIIDPRIRTHAVNNGIDIGEIDIGDLGVAVREGCRKRTRAFHRDIPGAIGQYRGCQGHGRGDTATRCLGKAGVIELIRNIAAAGINRERFVVIWVD